MDGIQSNSDLRDPLPHNHFAVILLLLFLKSVLHLGSLQPLPSLRTRKTHQYSQQTISGLHPHTWLHSAMALGRHSGRQEEIVDWAGRPDSVSALSTRPAYPRKTITWCLVEIKLHFLSRNWLCQQKVPSRSKAIGTIVSCVVWEELGLWRKLMLESECILWTWYWESLLRVTGCRDLAKIHPWSRSVWVFGRNDLWAELSTWPPS